MCHCDSDEDFDDYGFVMKPWDFIHSKLGGVVLNDVGALGEDDDPVAELHGLVEVVGDDDDRLLQLLLDLDQLVLQPLPRDGIDRAEGLVHEEHGRVGGEGAGHSDALLLAAGEFLRVPVPVDIRVEGDELQQLVDPRADPLLRPAQHLRHIAMFAATVMCGKRPPAWMT